MIVDVVGKPLKVGDLVAYGVSRASMALAVIHELIDSDKETKIKVTWPNVKTEQMKTAPYTVLGRTWISRRSVLSRYAAIAVLNILDVVPNTEYKQELIKIYRTINHGR